MFRTIPRRRLLIGTAAAASSLSLASYSYSRASQPIYLDSQKDDVKRRPGPLWAPPTREQNLAHLKTSGRYISRENGPGPVLDATDDESDDDVFDLLIVGGGATGSGTALDAASRGLKVACVERDDFASGESI